MELPIGGEGELSKQRSDVYVEKNLKTMLERIAKRDNKSLENLIDEILHMALQKLKEDPHYLLKRGE